MSRSGLHQLFYEDLLSRVLMLLRILLRTQALEEILLPSSSLTT